jgi:2Fe-2S ferredoxin
VPKVTFIDSSGQAVAIDAAAGESLMSTAVRHGVPGVVGECGGNASCATCHVYIDDAYLPRLEPIGDMEEDLLDLGVSDRRPGSRLSCQIRVRDELDGMVVHTPESQA